MRMFYRVSLLSVGFLLSQVAAAHHSQAFFDMTQCKTITGTIRTFQYQYPHSWMWIYVTNAQGGQDVWGFEAAAPAQMIEVDAHWKRDIVKNGDKVTIKYSPMKDGRNGGALATLTLPDGATLRAATPACSAELGSPK